MSSRTFLEYKRYRYLKITVVLVIIVILAYLLDQPDAGHYGGTWLGYTLGVLAALIVVVLLWLGVRKRQYRSANGNVLGWLSAHVYLGTSLLVIATLHSGFELGWNIHSLAYVLMLAVIFSGFYGVVVYLRLPRLMTDNMGEDTLDTLLLKISDIDSEAQRIALELPNEINDVVLHASQATRIGGNVFQQLSGRQKNCPTALAIQTIQDAGAKLAGERSKTNQALYLAMLRKQTLVERARQDVKLKARLNIWLYLHVPLSIAMLAALIAHIVSVFFYW